MMQVIALSALAVMAGASLAASQITVQVDATVEDGDSDVYYLVFETVAPGYPQISAEDQDFYAQLRALRDEVGRLGKVGSLEYEIIDRDNRLPGGFRWRAWREWKVPRNMVADRTLALYATAIEKRTGYAVRFFPGAVEDLSQGELERIFKSAEREGRRQAEKIAKAQGRSLGELIETKWLNSGELTGVNPNKVGRVFLRLTFRAH